MSRKFRGMASFEMMQSLAVMLLVLLLMLAASAKIGGLLRGEEERLSSQLLALQVVGRLDSFQRNACGSGFCGTVFVVNTPAGCPLSFLPDRVAVGNGTCNASAISAFPLDALEIVSEETSGGTMVSVSG